MPVLPILSLDKVASLIRGRTRKNSDAVLCISGFEGVGKSTFGIILSYILDPSFDLWKNILYSPSEEEFLEKINVMHKGSVLNLDEAVKMLEKQDWSKQTFIKKTFQVIRGKNLITLLLIPRLEDLNEYFRNWRVMLNLCITHRGFGYLQVPDPYNKKDVWHTAFNQAKLDSALRGETFHTAELGEVMKAISEYKGFLGFFNFPPLPKEVEKEYVKLKDKYSLHNLENEKKAKEEMAKEDKQAKKDREREEKEELALKAKDLKDMGYKKKDIAKELGITYRKVGYVLNEI